MATLVPLRLLGAPGGRRQSCARLVSGESAGRSPNCTMLFTNRFKTMIVPSPRVAQIGPQPGKTWSILGQCWSMLAAAGPNLVKCGPSETEIGPVVFRFRAKLGRCLFKFGRPRANQCFHRRLVDLGPNLTEFAPISTEVGPNLVNIVPRLVDPLPIWG